MTDLAVRASGVMRSYGNRRALDGFSVEVPRGAVFGLLGPNGSGKSTFIAMLAAMERPSAGTIEVFGERPNRALLRRIGTVFQENTADPLMRTGEYLRFAAALFGVPRGQAAGRAEALLDRFGLNGRSGDAVGTLSGGMRRRLEVARALMHEPELLLLDEPTTGVDAEERARLWSALAGVAGGPTILLATNDLTEAEHVCGDVAFVRQGRVVAEGAPRALKAGLRAETVRLVSSEVPATALALIAPIPGVGEVTAAEETIAITTDDSASLIPRLFEVLAGKIRSVEISPATLEDAYFFHVGRRELGGSE